MPKDANKIIIMQEHLAILLSHLAANKLLIGPNFLTDFDDAARKVANVMCLEVEPRTTASVAQLSFIS